MCQDVNWTYYSLQLYILQYYHLGNLEKKTEVVYFKYNCYILFKILQRSQLFADVYIIVYMYVFI